MPDIRSVPADSEQQGASADDIRVLARGGALNLLGAVCNGLFGFVLAVVLTRGLGASRAGAFFEAIGVSLILSHAAGLGADIGLMRTIARHLALNRTGDLRRSIAIALGPVVVAGVVLAVTVFLTAPALAKLLAEGSGERALVSDLRILGPLLPIFAVYTVLSAGSRGFGTMLPSVLVDRIGRSVLQPVLVLAVLLVGAGGTLVALGWAAPIVGGFVASLVWMLALVRRAERQDRSAARSARTIRELASRFWRFAAPRGLASLFQVTYIWLNTLFVGALLSTAAAGIYTASTRYLVAGAFVTTSIVQATGPKISELFARRQLDRAAVIYQTATGWMVGLAWPIYLTLAIFAPVLVRVFGPEFEAGAVPLRIAAIAMLVAAAAGPVDMILLMAGRSTWNLANTVLALGANIVLNLLLIPRLGLAGAAIAWGVSIATNNLLPLTQVWFTMHLHPFGRGMLRASASAALCYGGLGLLAVWLADDSLVAFLAFGVTATALYGALLWRSRDAMQIMALGDALKVRRLRPRGAVR